MPGVNSEKQDVLDENGKPTGKVKTREEIHKDNNWHLSVHAWIINSMGELLIQKRAPEKESNPNKWDMSAGGHVMSGDSEILTITREFEEELGIKIDQSDLKYIFTVRQKAVLKNGTYINNEINPVYLIKKDLDLSKMVMQKEEVSEVKWIPWQELEKKINENDSTFVPHPEEYKKLFEYLNKHSIIL